ncbi:hypothetical protein [Caulobacter sp.]|uniref:hypothetical protein n=1 Tax=Caulobacter sp. TaxID=78 RepID=UPI001B1A065F|nr:hypothetical protein [Caulobacter sp.]MBO9546536.1 hypothetical protein [Caulobacter sp.]
MVLARRVLLAASVASFMMGAIALAAGVAIGIIDHAVARVFPPLIKAFYFAFAGAAGLVLCGIDRKLEGLAYDRD